MHYRILLPACCLWMTLGLPSHFALGQVETMVSETDLIAVLQNGPDGDKAMACKRLSVYGSPKAVPELAKLLSDQRLASWTRIALEAIPGKESDEALREACRTLQGNLLVGTINSIGVRRDAEAVAMLEPMLQNQDPEAASAAAVALGKIGGNNAAKTLRSALAGSSPKVRSAIAEGCVLCAERFLAEGNAVMAIEIYDQIRKADVPTPLIVEATRGVILARKTDGIPLLIEQLGSKDKSMFQLALQTAREIPSPALGKALLAELNKADTQRAPLIVQALADMPGAVELPAIVQLANKGTKEVRMAAISAMGRIGDVSCVAPLLSIATDSSDLIPSVRAALVEIPDEAVNREIISRIPNAKNDVNAQLLIETAGLRRIEATKELVKALESTNANIRRAALDALGDTITQDRLSILIDQAIASRVADDATVARKALRTAAIRMPDREACATQLTDAMRKAPVPAKVAILETLGEMGGAKALQTMGNYAKDPDPQLQDTSSSQLGKWMTADAAPVLMELAKSNDAARYRSRFVRGYLRIPRQFVMSEKERLEMCTQAMEIATQPADQKALLEVLQRNPSLDSLKLAIRVYQNPDVKEDAAKTAQAISDKLASNKEAQELMAKAGLSKP